MSQTLHNGLRRARARLAELEDENRRMFAEGVLVPAWLRRRNERERAEMAQHVQLLEQELGLDGANAAPQPPVASDPAPVVRLTPADRTRAPTSSTSSGKRVNVPRGLADEAMKLRNAWDAAGRPSSGPVFAELARFMRALS